jgi:predicted transcriptional regulator
VLRRGSRHFQLAHQVGLLTQGHVLDRIAKDPILTTPESRAFSAVDQRSLSAATSKPRAKALGGSMK